MTEVPQQPIQYYYAPPAVPYAGLRAGSRVLGLVAIALGGLIACARLLVMLGTAKSRHVTNTATSAGRTISVSLQYIEFVVASFVFGIGAIRLRRWVRPVAITGGVLSVFYGMIISVSLSLWIRTPATLKRNPGGSPHAAAIALGMVIFIVLAVVVILPGIYVWFFKKRQVLEMLEHYDPHPRWTDRCPLPVLGIAIALFVFGIGELALAPDAFVTFGGWEFTGLTAVGILLVTSAAMLALSRLVFRCRAFGWWGSFVLSLLWGATYAIALVRLPRFGGSRGTSLVAAARQSNAITGVSGVILALFSMGYLIYARKYFFKNSERS